MFINLLLLLSALSLSSIAGYYSVIGMTAIFAAAWWPVVIMTGMLEFSKVVVAAWLHRNWRRTPFLLKSYLSMAVIVLMFITSLGIFGFLSKAHIEQTSGLGNNRLFIEQIDQQITVEQGRIEDARKVMQQMDDAVNSLLRASTQQSSARNATVAQQAARLRQSQAKDRAQLTTSINESNSKIRELNTQKLKLDQEQLKLEVEVGPIKYIAEMIYGNNPEKDLLEKAVRYVIILIIFVFDPLAILMIIAASTSFPGTRKHTPVADDSLDQGAPVETDSRMTYRQAVDEIRASDQKNETAWTDQQSDTSSVTNIAMRYPQAGPRMGPAGDANVISTVRSEQVNITATQDDLIKTETEIQSETAQIQDPDASPAALTQLTSSDALPSERENQEIAVAKPDEVLQKIKQYHSVRLEDARRSIR
jgi:hypothetical protein